MITSTRGFSVFSISVSFLASFLFLGAAAEAQPCAGDCDGNGQTVVTSS
jgi:hypothetical protein